MAPTNEEEEKLVKYQDELEDLDPAEKFVKEVLRIPFAFAKIEVMLYKESFQDEVSHLSSSFSMLEVYIYIYISILVSFLKVIIFLVSNQLKVFTKNTSLLIYMMLFDLSI